MCSVTLWQLRACRPSAFRGPGDLERLGAAGHARADLAVRADHARRGDRRGLPAGPARAPEPDGGMRSI